MHLYPSLMLRLQTQHEALPNLIAQVDAVRLRWKPLPEKWSIQDNLAHLTRYQLVFLERLDQILRSSTPAFEPYRAELDPLFEEWQRKEVGSLVEHLATDRRRITDLISQLSAIDVEKAGLHTTYGRLNVVEWTEFFLLHEAHHLFTIFQLAHQTTS